jgi:hypothetical protein
MVNQLRSNLTFGIFAVVFFNFYNLNAQEGVKALQVWEEFEKAFGGEDEPAASRAYMSYQLDYSNFDTVAVEFECLGPNSQPEERSTGGRAIPTYSVGRGNGTGRVNHLYVNPSDSMNVFACSPTGGLFVTYDGGEHWENAGTDKLPVSGVASVTIDQECPGNWIIATGDSDDRFMFCDGIWRTCDAGKNWVNINGITKGKTFPVSEKNYKWTFTGKVLAHPCFFNRVFVATNKGLYATNNALDPPDKVKWKKIAPTFFYDLEFHPDDPTMIFASGNKFMVSRDCGLNWEYLTLPTWEEPEKFTFLRFEMEFSLQNTDYIYAAVTCADKFGTAKMGIASFQKYHIETDTWTKVRSLKKGMNNMIPTRGRAFDVSPVDTSLVLIGNVQPVFRSVDGGITFKKVERGQMHDDIHSITFDPNGRTVWCSHDGGVSRSLDGGITWHNRDSGIGAANVFGVSVAQSEDWQVLYGAYDTGGNLLKDEQWYHVTWGDGFQTIIDHSDPDIMVSSKQSGHINKTIDGGESWEESISCGQTKADWHTWIKMNRLHSNIFYCGGTKLVRSFNQGEDWDILMVAKEVEDSLVSAYKFFLSETNADVMYVYLLDDERDPHLYRTFNVNEEEPDSIIWERLEVPREGWISSIVVDANEPEKFWLSFLGYGADKKVLRYNGETWIDIGKELDYAIVECMILDKTSEERIYVGTNHGVYTRNNEEENWTLLTGMPGVWMKSMDINYVKKKLVIGTHGRGVWACDLLPE